jgi:hypothetical protein
MNVEEEDEDIPFYNKDANKVIDSYANKLRRVATSAMLFALAFITSNLILQVLIARLARSFKYAVKFSYNQVTVLPWDYHYWSRTHVVLIYLFAPAICFAIGLVIYYILRMNTTWAGVSRIFFFWLSLCLVNMVLTHAIIAPLGSPTDRNNGLYQTFAVVGAFLWVNPTLMGMASIGALIGSMGVGMLIRQELVRYSYSQKLIRDKKGTDGIVIQVYVLPVLLVGLPLVLLCTQNSFFTTLMQLANLAVISIGIFLINTVSVPGVRASRKDILNHLPIVETAIFAIVWLGVFMFLK